ncbi:MAG: ABC transporter ATP-binding protein [Betaproteobacteria bacterium]|nr:ABC transporter ATP-binding protein [Betaproteobacteria bacterium]
MLETEQLSVQFGGHLAVDQVSCRFSAGTLTAIVGPNGAGKTTYFNLISGQPLRARKGLGRAFQLTQLFPQLSVIENVRLAVQARAQSQDRSKLAWLDLLSLWSDKKAWIEETEALLAEVQLSAKADLPAASLSHGDQRKLEVALLMALKPKVYMFDEPTAGMSVDDVPIILALIQRLKRQSDRTILLVEHKMDVVHQLADRIVVLHQGSLVADGAPTDVMASTIVQQAYLGQSPGALPSLSWAEPGSPT